MIKEKFIDIYFKWLVLLFWPIMWYKLKLLPNPDTDFIIFISYFILSIIFIVLLITNHQRHKNKNTIIIYYKLSMITTFLFTIISFVLFPTNEIFLLLKIFFIFILIYISSIKTYKYKIEEGVVGILTSLLIFVLTVFY